MNLNSMFAKAKLINDYNKKLNTLLTPPLNQLKLAQLSDNIAIFVAKNQSILNFGIQQTDLIFNVLTVDLKIDIKSVDIKLLQIK